VTHKTALRRLGGEGLWRSGGGKGEHNKREHRFVAAPAQSVKFMRPTRSATHDRCKRSPIRRLGTEDWRIDSEDWRLSAGDRRAKTAAEDEDEDEDGEEDQDEAVEEQPANFISRNKSMTDLCTAQSLQITNVYVYWMNVRLQPYLGVCVRCTEKNIVLNVIFTPIL